MRNEHCIPAELKTQYITPIYKKGGRTDPANHRPVSLTSHIIKTFERASSEKPGSSFGREHDDQYEPAWVQKKEELNDAAS